MSLQVSCNGVDLENTDTPKYLGVTLDRTLSCKTHIQDTKMKVATRNNLLNKLANSRRGTNARTIRTEYEAPVWERSAHAHLLNSELKSRRSFLTTSTTSSLPSKRCPSQRMEEKTGGEGTCRLSHPVRGSSHGA